MLSHSDICLLLNNDKLLRSLPNELRQMIAASMCHVQVKKNHVMIIKGSKPGILFFITSHDYIDLHSGLGIHDIKIQDWKRLSYGDYWGVDQLIYNKPAEQTLIVEEGCSLFLINRFTLKRLVQEWCKMKGIKGLGMFKDLWN